MPAPSRPTLGSTSSDLLSRVRSRDTNAWERLTDLYGPLVYYWCRRSGLQDADTADVVQNVFMALARGIDGYRPRPDATFRGWLWTVTQARSTPIFDAIGPWIRLKEAARPNSAWPSWSIMHPMSRPIPRIRRRLRPCYNGHWSPSATNSRRLPGRPSGEPRSRESGPST